MGHPLIRGRDRNWTGRFSHAGRGGRSFSWKAFPQRLKPIEVARVMYELKLVPFIRLKTTAPLIKRPDKPGR
jgi:hypothetical protein